MEPEENLIESIMSDLTPIANQSEVWVLKNRDGQILKLPSGKSQWKRRNHATSALTNFIGMTPSWWKLRDSGFREPSEIKDYLIGSGIIKLEQIF